MSLNKIEHSIIRYMAKTMFAVAWADYQEQVLHKGLRGEIMDQVPETPDYVLQEAYYQAGQLANANKESIFHLFRKALKADVPNMNEIELSIMQRDEALQHAFGYGMIMPMMGHGVSWFDDHEKFQVVYDHFEWSHLDLDPDVYPDLVRDK